MPDQDEGLKQAAAKVACPRCGSAPGMSCRNFYGRFVEAMHGERLAVSLGLPGKENRQTLLRRAPGQGRMDPTVRVRRIEDEAA